MVDRTDIDALLIGALYGELTPADEARLTAHLESHPADRTALDDLTRTRAAVRDSRILTFQREPPQAISALLLQEASRRAPRARTHRGEAVTWFQRFVRSFMAHPAMAAAATLVLVIAAAGTFYLRGTEQFVQSEAPTVAPERAAPSVTTSAGAASAPARAPEPEASGAGAGSSAPTGSVAGSGDEVAADPSRPAQLDGAAKYEGAVARDRRAEQAAAASDQPQAQGELDGRAPYEKAKAGKRVMQDAQLRKLSAPDDAAPPKADRPASQAVRGLELRTPQLEPKDFKDSDDEKPAGRQRRSAAAPAGGGSPASTPPPPPAAPANAPAPRAAGPAAAADVDVSPAQPAPAASEAKRPPAKPSANQLPPPSAANAQLERRLDSTSNAANNANGDAKQTQGDRALLEWARKQREQVIAYVNANRCRDAASTAVEIYNRAPDYYSANVATDRQIKPCLAYVNDQRDRADRARANKNAADVQAPAQAAPARK
jgi:hypothetical protein